MSVLDEVSAGHPVPSMSMEEKIARLQSDLDTTNLALTNVRQMRSNLESKISEVKDYLVDCRQSGQDCDIETIADLLDIDLTRSYTVYVDMRWTIEVEADSESAAQDIIDGISFYANGDHECDDFEIVDTEISES